ncbi:aminopeptidase N [Amycolatopsis sp. cmx-4-68]|uniref:aminopeptidase N n=1 Tax=Amycolatopsis sp. cmx-4-68 TaxID=2790938 RepID=UPI00397877F7
MSDLRQAEAEERSATIDVVGYRVWLDLDQGGTTFRSRTRVRFRCRRPGSTTFLDSAAAELARVTLNGRELPGLPDRRPGRITLPDLAEDNVADVEGEYRFSRDGQGLHRFVDPADDRIYLYSQHQVDSAHRVFACFDQPDLKAPWTLSVKAPADWVVAANSPVAEQGPGHWLFHPSKPCATYFMGLVAGHYVRFPARHRELPLAVYCRASLAEAVDHEEIFTVTVQCLDHFRELFGVPFPFEKYDQVFVPEFNAGGMENAALTTLRDDLIFRTPVADDSRTFRAVAIAHELAHMWFGDQVTLRWWDDLWLNESFAELMAFLAVAEATRFRTAWARFAVGRKNMGYRVDQEPGTHPVCVEVPATSAALANFDGITYAKGAAVLRQLMSRIGRTAFFDGLRTYLTEHAYGNATFDDFLTAMSDHAGQELRGWVDSWLHTANVNTLTVHTELSEDGADYSRVKLIQTAAPGYPVLREHHLELGLYDIDDGGSLHRRALIPVAASGSETEVPELAGARAAALIVPDDGDATWAKLRFDARSLTTLRHSLARLTDPVTRAVCWQALWDMTYNANLPVEDYLASVLTALPAEREASLVKLALVRCRTAIDILGLPERRVGRQRRLAECCRTMAEHSGPEILPLAIGGYVGATGEDDLAELESWLAGRIPWTCERPDADTRWSIIHRLAVHGACGPDLIRHELARDGSASGRRAAITAETALPDAAGKQRALDRLGQARGGSNHELRACADGLFPAEQLDVTEPFAEQAIRLIPALWEIHDAWLATRLARRVFPSTHATKATAALVARIGAGDLDTRARRILVGHEFALGKALRARELDDGRRARR